MNIALYIADDKNSQEFSQIIKETILELDPNIEIIEIEDQELKENNWEHLIKIFRPHNLDCILTVGDTGTFLRAVFLNRLSIPVISASSDRSSFFTEIAPDNIYENIPLILNEKYLEDSYDRICLKETKKNKSIPALNEIAIFPRDSAMLMHYTIVIDNNTLYRGRADGLIFSTPLGSTGYALSSGGPIAYGDPKILLIVPVNPLNKEHIPVVLPIDKEIKLLNLRSRTPVEAIIDGQLRIQLNGEINIQTDISKTKVIRFHSRKNILAKLRNRLVELDLKNLRNAPPSAKYIFKLLLTEGEMTQKELIESTGLPNRTVRNALNILKDRGVISQRPHLRDARQSIYFVS